MKKLVTLIVFLCACVSTYAKTDFLYKVGAEANSAYIWRGQYWGGMSFQPSVELGCKGEHWDFSVEAWGSIGASDWKFTKAQFDEWGAQIDGTYFVPEFDLTIHAQFYGLNLGVTHYYYFDGSKYLPTVGSPVGNSSQLEVSVGYNLGDISNIGLYVNANTIVMGEDGYFKTDGEGNLQLDSEGNVTYQRAWSTYIEAGYEINLPLGFTLTPAIGITPFKSRYNGYEDGLWSDKQHLGIVNAQLRLEKTWTLFKHFSLSLYAEGMVNAYGINKDNLWIGKTGVYKMDGAQKLNGNIGASIWLF